MHYQAGSRDAAAEIIGAGVDADHQANLLSPRARNIGRSW